MPRDLAVSVTLLGTGTSTGVPVIGCTCAVCTSSDPHNKRLRAACWIQTNGISLLVDTGPDLRRQALRAGITRADAVLYTHHHYDHVSGIDDLRPFGFDSKAPIPCYAHPETVRTLNGMFGYIFSENRYPSAPNLRLTAVDSEFQVRSRYPSPKSHAEPRPDPVTVVPIPALHGTTPVYGYRVGNFAYITDTNQIPDTAMQLLSGVDTLVLDGLRHEPHPTHFTVAEAIEAAHVIGARRTYFTHLTHTMDHARENALLPPGISLAYDGLSFDVDAN
jgi:phosphoribosyl 1,2-cyclic phosphate phosphodiesterase